MINYKTQQFTICVASEMVKYAQCNVNFINNISEVFVGWIINVASMFLSCINIIHFCYQKVLSIVLEIIKACFSIF